MKTALKGACATRCKRSLIYKTNFVFCHVYQAGMSQPGQAIDQPI
jgi:hypothetical protein